MVQREERWWLRVYLQLAPVAALASAAIISGVARAWPPWASREDLEFFAVLVTLGLACYGALIWILELVGVAMLWAYSKYKDWRATARQNTATARQNTQKNLLLALSASGYLDISELTQEDLRKLGLEDLDLTDLQDPREREPA